MSGTRFKGDVRIREDLLDPLVAQANAAGFNVTITGPVHNGPAWEYGLQMNGKDVLLPAAWPQRTPERNLFHWQTARAFLVGLLAARSWLGDETFDDIILRRIDDDPADMQRKGF